jgi:nitrogen fixation protein NifQ
MMTVHLLHFVPTGDLLARRTRRDDEVDEVRALLLDHADDRAGTTDECHAVAETVALACLGDNHLWEDLQLPNRAALTALMARWFPRLAAKNTGDMKWKRFLYRQLCDRAEVQACRAPSCGVCSDYGHCFGPEEALAA